MATTIGAQENCVSNKARGLIFFEGSNLCYNYKTGQWTLLDSYDGYTPFSVNSKTASIGIIRFEGQSVDLQVQNYSATTQRLGRITTALRNFNPEGRAVVGGVEPIYSGSGSVNIRVDVRDYVTDSDTEVSMSSIHSRTGISNGRAEGRYHKIKIIMSNGGFDTLMGCYVDFTPVGKV